MSVTQHQLAIMAQQIAQLQANEARLLAIVEQQEAQLKAIARRLSVLELKQEARQPIFSDS